MSTKIRKIKHKTKKSFVRRGEGWAKGTGQLKQRQPKRRTKAEIKNADDRKLNVAPSFCLSCGSSRADGKIAYGCFICDMSW